MSLVYEWSTKKVWKLISRDANTCLCERKYAVGPKEFEITFAEFNVEDCLPVEDGMVVMVKNSNNEHLDGKCFFLDEVPDFLEMNLEIPTAQWADEKKL